MLPVVDDLADGRLGGCGNENQIEPLISCHLERLAALYDAKLLTFRSDQSDITVFQYPLIDLRPGLGARRSSKACYVVSPQIFA